MKKTGMFRAAILILAVLASAPACTENPFGGDDPITGSPRVLSGTVALDEEATPEGVYVWMAGFELSAWTNSEGHFELTLPAPGSQPGGGLSGTFNVYFYVANYTLDSVEVALRNGELLTSQGDVGDDGSLRNPILLHKLLDIQMKMIPASKAENLDVDVILETTLMAVFNTSVDIITFGNDTTDDVYMTGVLFKRIDDPLEEFTVTLFSEIHLSELEIDRNPNVFKATFRMADCIYPQGQYEFIPYIWVKQPGIPVKLIESLGTQVEVFDRNYENLPFKQRSTAVLTISAPIIDEFNAPCHE